MLLAMGHGACAATTDQEITPTPSDNFSAAHFRLWLPDGVATVRGAVILVPGWQGNGMGWADDKVWQAFAQKEGFCLVGCSIQSKGGIPYYRADGGAGQALLTALKDFAKQSGHPEIEKAPLLLWGHSAGGQFNYNFSCWKPARVIAFVVNKGGYYDALSTSAVRRVPALIFAGQKDSEVRRTNLAKLFNDNRRQGARWALAVEPNTAHEMGRTRDLALPFFEAVVKERLSDSSTDGQLTEVDETGGWLGDLDTHQVSSESDYSGEKSKAAWLPDEQTARNWQAFVGDSPVTGTSTPVPHAVPPLQAKPQPTVPPPASVPAATQSPSATPVPASAAPQAPPTQAVLKAPVDFDAIFDGKVAGSITAQPGATVKIISTNGSTMVVEYMGSQKTIPASAASPVNAH